MKKSLNKIHYDKRKIKSKVLFYKTLIDKSSDSILCLDRNGKYIYVNHAYADLLNRKRADLIGKKMCDFYSYNEWQKRLDVINEVFETGKTNIIEFKIHKKDSIIYLLTSVKLIKDNTNNENMVLCISKDITELKKVEEELNERELLLCESLRVAHIGSYEVDINSGIWKCSEELNLILGIDETYPHTLEGWLELIHPDWRTKLIKYKSELDAEKPRFDCEYKIIRFNDQEERWIHGLGELKINKQGEALQMVGTIQDITEYKKIEEEIIYLIYHDKLTGLYNRRFYEEEIKRIDTERNIPISIIIGDVNGLKLINDAFGHSKGDELLQKAAISIKSVCRNGDIIIRWGGDEFVMLLPRTEIEEAKEIVERAKELCSQEYVNNISISISFGFDTKIKTDEDILKVLKSAEDYMYNHKIIEKEHLRGKTINTIISTFHKKNPKEKKHAERVCEICKEIGETLCMLQSEIDKLQKAGFLHDIGKIAIEENLINKAKNLTQQEENEIKRHPDIGYRILSSSYDMLELADYIYAHHERWDGSGYPKGLKGEQIPMISRIIFIAESYDTMINEQPYRKTLSEEEALTEILNNAGTQFDPEIAKAFVEMMWNKLR